MIDRWLPSKRHLGVGYLVGIGVAFALIVLARLVSGPIDDFDLILAIATSGVLIAGLVYTGFWLYDGPLDDASVWAVAKWGAVGLAIPTFFSILTLSYFPVRPSVQASFFVSVIAAGGVVGALVGTISELNDKHEQTVELYDRNTLLQRVLRHNVRTSMNTIRGYADVLETNLQGTPEEMARSIRRKADGVIDIGETARNATAIDDSPVKTPVDVAAILEDLLEAIEQYYPHARIEADLPDEAWVAADNLLELALWHLLENGIEHHHGQTPTIAVSIDRSSADSVVIEIADDGPGLPADLLDSLRNDRESRLEHIDGLGVWLAKWLVESFDGGIEFTAADPTGTVVRIELDPVDPPDRGSQLTHVEVGDS